MFLINIHVALFVKEMKESTENSFNISVNITASNRCVFCYDLWPHSYFSLSVYL